MDIIFIYFIMCWLSLQLALESQAESVILSDGNQESVESKKSISSHRVTILKPRGIYQEAKLFWFSLHIQLNFQFVFADFQIHFIKISNPFST